jgi:hypothetical protein
MILLLPIVLHYRLVLIVLFIIENIEHVGRAGTVNYGGITKLIVTLYGISVLTSKMKL